MRQGPSLSQAPAAEAKRGDAAVQHDTASMVAPGFRGELGGKRCRIFSWKLLAFQTHYDSCFLGKARGSTSFFFLSRPSFPQIAASQYLHIRFVELSNDLRHQEDGSWWFDVSRDEDFSAMGQNQGILWNTKVAAKSVFIRNNTS